jgi:hypothetical protein
MEVNIRWNVTDLAAVDSDLVCKHARGRNLDRVRPVVVVVAEGIGEVKDSILRDLRRVLCDVEVSGLHGTLGYSVRHEEEVETTLNNF